jgi:hypothetical protein
VLKTVDVRAIASAVVEELASEPDISPDLARDAFATINVPLVTPYQGHTHRHAASHRSSATQFAAKMAAYCGCSMFILGMSRSDQRKNYRGTRQWYWAKDTNVCNRNDCPLPDDIEYICDVDYYLDMPTILASRGKPTLLYSVVPEEAASHVDDTTIFFNEDGSLFTSVAGGGSYNHYLWDYSGDSLIVSTGSLFWRKVVTYAIERKQVAKNRQLILLSPIKIFTGLMSYLASYLVEGKVLSRLNPIVTAPDGTKYVKFHVHGPSGYRVTVGKPGTTICATVTSDVDTALATVAALGSSAIQIPTVCSWLGPNERVAAALLTEYHRKSVPRSQCRVYTLEIGVRAYQYEPRSFDQEAKPKLQAFMQPLYNGAFAPVPNAAGERRCVEGRINSLKKQEPPASSFRDQCMTEFVDFVIGGEVLEPVDYQVVYDKQKSPSQRQSLARAVLNGPWRKRVLKCFLKAEAYMDVKDPRNISTYNDADKFDMATFALALSEHCKRLAWYGPGKTPREIANRVVEICANAQFVNVSDYHRMDGTISYVLRQVDRCAVMKAFPAHRAHLNELLKTNADNKGYLPHGTTFDQGPSHGSGCSATSLFQTLRAAFTAYLGYRHAYKTNGGRYTPAEAFNALGIHLGDDGLDGDLSPADHQWACHKVGLILEAQVVCRGERGVNFLARYYSPDVWFGNPNSMCDVKRQLSKFHTTVRLPSGVPPEHKLVEKCMSYAATDASTPVIGAFCTKVLSISKFRPRKLLGIGNWWAQFEDSVQYPNTNVDGWMDVEFNALFPEFDRVSFIKWMDTAATVEEMLEPPLFAVDPDPTPQSADVVVDGRVVQAKKPPSPSRQARRRRNPKRKTGES